MRVCSSKYQLMVFSSFFQATRVRFVFGNDALEVKIGDQLEESGENAFVGGKNRWKYSTFVNWELWWPSFPILAHQHHLSKFYRVNEGSTYYGSTRNFDRV
ncbi:hypothetical protein SDJN02_17935, partial [Cucurbita argyrosperma subsp. argyrosperma]